MRKEILSFGGSNMAGFDWTWSFQLQEDPDGRFTLSALQTMEDPNDQEDAFVVAPIVGLKRGADIYAALDGVLGEISEDIEQFDLDEIADQLLEFGDEVADQFRRGKLLLHQRDLREAREAEQAKTAALEPFQRAIQEYCEKLDDTRPRGGGGISLPSERSRVRAFLEHYVQTHGALPTGFHSWTLGNGFLSGSHDFGQLDRKTDAKG